MAAGRALEHLPAVAAAFAAGRVTAEAVAVIAPVARDGAPGRGGRGRGRPGRGRRGVLADTAATRPVKELAQVVHHYLARLDPDGTEPDPTEGRRFVDRPARRRQRGPAASNSTRSAGRRCRPCSSRWCRPTGPPGDLRSRAQQQADALVQLADNTLAAGNLPILRTVKPHVVVTIDHEDLADPHTGHGAARTGFGALISAARARMLACDGGVTRIVFGPDGQPLDLGREKRLFPPHIRRALDVRDQGCVFAGCHAPTWWCDAHHVLHWIDGGETSVENGALLCERHHTKVHHGFRIERQPDGRWRTYRPDGTEILMPEPLLAA